MSNSSGKSTRKQRKDKNLTRPYRNGSDAPGETKDHPLRIIPLGGMHEVGKNMTVFEYKDEIIIIDCGMGFPDNDMLGVDVIIPDFTYLRENRHKITGLFITHGHEDHIGAIPWLLDEFDIPVYATPLTIKLIENKLESRNKKLLAKADLRQVKAGDTVDAGKFSVRFIHINHSVPDAASLAVRSPVGTVIITGDFKVDYSPIKGDPIDLGTFAELGSEGVLALISDSTNIEREGHSMSESKVGEAFSEIFANASGRIIVTTFASNVWRLQQVITAAERYGRKVLILGRSMLNTFAAATQLEYLDYNPKTIINMNELDNYPAEQLVLLTTGSQGEPMAALTRLAFSEHHSVEIMTGDTVVLSSSMIPGNEQAIYKVIDALFRQGADVIYHKLAELHASGHAFRDELLLINRLVRPKFFIPGHGEYRMLYTHAKLINDMGTPSENIAILKNGDILELYPDSMSFAGFTEGEGIPIDGSGMGDIDEYVLHDRRLLADDGVVTIALTLDKGKDKILGEPDIQARGFIYSSEMNHIVNICRERLDDMASKQKKRGKPLVYALTEKNIKNQIQRALFEYTRRRPVVIVSINVL
ncbi:MAG: ribonuclease J [Fastidiosipila sp.]|nr:ribonuclease J [Fastidiosipila sp.]